MSKYLYMGFILMLMLTGCGGQEATGADQPAVASDHAPRANHAEVAQGDFVYRLVSESETYESGNNVNVYAELEYVGELGEITIGHASSAFYFPMKELTRGYNISYGMNEPYITTTLKKGEPLREQSGRAGGYSEHDDKKFKEFVHELSEGYPTGEYVVYGSADFVIDPSSYPDQERSDTETERYKIEAEITFAVK
ncbi:hypothetical protein JCM10914A_26800 [Paenibacillus sp. JCM 10914]|uniref:hypothetical protein n=1 Tax=Paenibacillus sp. JCM 10914 TaxID=1236974 RepID=UPI00055DDFCE|nr:hypothetical protein [Paenibacillus sp. JCM 10914]